MPSVFYIMHANMELWKPLTVTTLHTQEQTNEHLGKLLH